MSPYNAAIVDVFAERKSFHQLAEEGMDLEKLLARWEDVFRGNDVEGAAIGVAAVMATYPNHDSDEFFERINAIIAQRCPMIRLDAEAGVELPDELELKVEEMTDVIMDAAERLALGA